MLLTPEPSRDWAHFIVGSSRRGIGSPGPSLMYFLSQEHVDDRKDGVEEHESSETERDARGRYRRYGEERRQYALNGPRLPTMLGRRTSQSQRRAKAGAVSREQLKKCAALGHATSRSEVEADRKECNEEKAQRHHQSKRPEHGTHRAGPYPRRPCRSALALPVRGSPTYSSQQQRVSEIIHMVFQHLTGRNIVGVLAQYPKSRIRWYAIHDPLLRAANKLENPRNLRVE